MPDRFAASLGSVRPGRFAVAHALIAATGFTPSVKPVAAINAWATAKRPGRTEPRLAAKRSGIAIQHRLRRRVLGAPSGVVRQAPAGLRHAAGAPVELLARADRRVLEDLCGRS